MIIRFEMKGRAALREAIEKCATDECAGLDLSADERGGLGHSRERCYLRQQFFLEAGLTGAERNLKICFSGNTRSTCSDRAGSYPQELLASRCPKGADVSWDR